MALIKEIADKEKKKKSSQTVAQKTAAKQAEPKKTFTSKDRLAQYYNRNSSLNKKTNYVSLVEKPKTHSFSIGTAGQKYSFDNKNASQMNLPEYTAMLNHTNSAYAIEQLPSLVDTRGSRYWNPYLGGRSTVPTEIINHFRDNYGYEGPFDEKFIEQFLPYEQFIENSDISWAGSKPSAKDPVEMWTGYYVGKIRSWHQEDIDTQAQWDEYRNALQTYYNEFKDITGRAPTIEEFSSAVDSNDYSKLASINKSLTTADDTIQILNTGTYYSPDAVYGLYHALSQGQDITTDRDYFQDAIAYYMSPLSTAQEIQKYSWSGADFTKMPPEDYTAIEHGIINSGDVEELAALRFARNAAYQDPEDVQIPLLVNEAYGYNHDDAWFEKAKAATQGYLYVSHDINGVPTYTKPSSKDSIGKQMAWYVHQEDLKREDTDAVEAEWDQVTKLVNDFASANRGEYELSQEGLDEFTSFIMDEIFGSEGATGLKIDTLKSYFDGKKDLCRITFASEDNLKAMIANAFTGNEVDSKTNYLVSAAAGENAEEVEVEPEVVELPPLYDEMQMQEGIDEAKARENNLNAIMDAVASFANSGANISVSDVEAAGISVMPDRVKEDTNLAGILGNLWHQFKKADYLEKLGEDYVLSHAAASDPVLKLFGHEQVDVPVTVNDLHVLMNEVQYSSGTGDVTLADGVLSLVIPNVNALQQHINGLLDRYGIQKTSHMLNSEIDVETYRNAYNRANEEGLNDEEATTVAFFAATDVAPVIKQQAMEYATPEAQTAFDEVMHEAMSEEGSSDVLAMAEHVASEVAAVNSESDFDEIPTGEPAELGSFFVPMIIGSSSKATPGLSAVTKDLMHDIATGDITPEDITKGIQVAIASGQTTSKQLEADAEKIAEPEKYTLSPLLEGSLPRVEASDSTDGMTDVEAKISEIAATNSPEQIAANKEAINLTDMEKWLEMSDFDAHLSLAQAFGYEASPMFTAMSYMEAYGQYFSDNEVREIYRAFQDGILSAEQVMDVIDDRISKYSPSALKASRNPEMVAESVSSAREYIENQKAGAAVIKPYTDEQLDTLSGFVDVFEQLGIYGYDYLSMATAEDYKNATEVDLVEAGVIDEGIPLSDLMDTMVGSSWRDAFENEGVGFLEGAGEYAEAVERWVLSLPSLFGKNLNTTMRAIGDAVGTDSLDSMWINSANRYNEMQRVEKSSKLREQEHAKAHEVFIKNAAIEATKMIASHGAGTALSSFINKFSSGVTTTRDLLELSGMAFDWSTFVARSPYSIVNALQDFSDYTDEGREFFDALGRSIIHASIEQISESPAVDHLLSFKLGDKTFMQRALSGMKKQNSYSLMLASNIANSIYKEVGEEELGLVIDRLITSSGMATNLEYTVGEAFAAGFEGIGEEAKATAITTAITMLFMNAADMPASYASYQQYQRMLKNPNVSKFDLDVLTTLMIEDLRGGGTEIKSEEVEAESDVEENAPIATESEPANENDEDSEGAESPRELIDAIKEIEETGKISPETAAKLDELGKQMRAPGTFGDLDDVEAVTEPLEPEAVNLAPDVNTFDNAHDDMPRQSAQEALKNEKPAAEEENITPEETPVVEVPALSPGAQRVVDYIEQSQPEVAKTLAKHHNDKEVEAMIANDPGIASKQDELKNVDTEIQRVEKEATQHQSEADSASTRTRQAFAAALATGTDLNGPQVLNSKFSLGQLRDAALKKVEDAQKRLEELREKRGSIEESIQKLKDGIALTADDYKNLDMFMRGPADQAIVDNNKAMNAVDPSAGAEMTSVDIANRENKRKSKENVAINAYSEGWVTAEEYTDPGRWDVQDRPNDSDDWKPSKEEQAAKNREDERHIKLNKDFDETLADEGWVEVNAETYNEIVDQLKAKRGYVDPSLARPKYDNGSMANGVAYIDGSPVDVYGVNGTREDGKTDTGDKYAHITESDQYLIVAKIDEDAPQTKEDRERYKGLTEEYDDGKTGLDRLREQVAEFEQQLQSAQNRKAKLELEVAKLEQKISGGEEGLGSQLTKARNDLKTCGATIRTVSTKFAAASKRLSDAIDFCVDFASKVNAEYGIDLEFDEDSPEYHLNTRDEIEDHKKRNREYIVIDKTARDAAESARSQDSINSLAEAAGITADNAFLSREGLETLLIHERLSGIDGEIHENLEKAIREEVEMMDEEDIHVALLDLYAERASNPMAAFSAVSQTLVGNKALEDFVKQHGGFKNKDGTEGAFSPRGTRTYQVRADVHNAYVEGSGWMRLKDDPQTGESYRESMQAKIDLYAQERGLTLEERNDLYASHLLNTKDEDGFETVGDNESGVLKVKREFGDSLDTNSAIRDYNGEFNIAKAREEVEAAVLYLDEVLAGLHSVDKESFDRQLEKNALWVELLEPDGSIVKRRYGQPFIGKDGQTRRFVKPALEMLNNALRIDLNRFRNNKVMGEDGTRLNFRLEKGYINKKTDRPYDIDAVHKDTAYLRPESQLKDDLAASQKHFESLMKSVTDMANTTESQQYAAYTFLAAYANLVENKINALSKRWKHGAPKDTLGSMIANMYSMQQKLKNVYQIMSTLDGYGTETGSIESSLNATLGKNRTNDEMWTQAAVAEGKPLLKELQDSFDRLASRYDALAAFGEESIVSKAEMAAVAAMASTVQHKINLMKNAGVVLDGYIPSRSAPTETVKQPVAKDKNVPARTYSVDASARLDARLKGKSLDEQVEMYSKMRDYTKRRVIVGQPSAYAGVDFNKKIDDALASEDTSENASQNLQLFGRSFINDIYNGIDQQIDAVSNPIKDEVEQPYEPWEDSTWRNEVKNSPDKEMVKDFEDGVDAINTMDEYNAIKKRIANHERRLNELQNRIDEHPTETDEDKAAKQLLIDQRAELRSAKERDVRILMASEFVDNVTSRESGVNPPADIANPTEAEKGVQSGSAKYRFNKAKNGLSALNTALKTQPGGNALGEGTLYTKKQLANALSTAIDAEAMAEDEAVARQVSIQKNKAKRRRAYLKFRMAYLRSLNAADNDGMNKARAEFRQSLLELDDPRGYTDSEVMERIQNEREVDATIDNLLREFDAAYHNVLPNQRKEELDGFQQMIDIIDATLERADRISSNLFKTSTADIERSLNHETGGHYARQIVDIAAQIVINASEKTSNPKKIIARAVDSPRRAIEKFLGKSSGIFNSIYMDPIRKANAEVARRTDDINRRVSELKLSKYAREKITLALDKGLSDADIRSEYGSYADEIIDGCKVVKGILNEIYSDIDAAFRRNGLEPPKWRKGYVPHIQKATGVAALVGMKTTWDDIPTELFGRTAEFKNTHQWAASLMARQGDSLNGCLTDIVEIVDTYTRSMLPVALYTDSIIALRDLEQVLREDMKYDDEGSVSKETAARMGVFVSYLGDIANQIAGKKAEHSADRWFENKMGGRIFLNLIQKLKTYSGMSATAANPNVITANFLPLAVAFAESPVNTIKGIQRALSTSIEHERSDFLQARKGSEKMEMDTGSKVVDAMYKPAQKSDSIVAAAVWETQYENCLQLGMAPEQARINADDRTARIMASKQRGDMPMAYSSVIGSTILQFTLESVNTISYLAHDMKNFSMANAKSVAGGAAKYLAALLALFLQGYLFNEATGRNTAPDVFGAVQDGVQGRSDEDNALDVIGQIVLNLSDSLNPVDSLTDAFAEGGSIMDLSPLTSNIASTWDNVCKAATFEDFETFATNAAGAILNWTPGGATVERVAKAVDASRKGYVESVAGRVKHTFSPDPLNIAAASLFGMNSTREGKAYVDSGYKTLSDAKTASMKRLMNDYGLSSEDAYRVVASESEEYNANKAVTAAEKNGEDAAEHEVVAAEARSNVSIPSDVASWAKGDTEAEWFKKGVQLWQESGLDVYPRDIAFDEGAMSEEEIEAVNAYYRKQYKYIVGGWEGTVQGLKKELDKAKARAKAKYNGGE